MSPPDGEREGLSLLSSDETVTASAVAALITDMRVWVHRRVEKAAVIDDVAVMRRSSIDFTVPDRLDGFPIRIGPALSAMGEGFVPIGFLKKERLRNFDLRDANGCPVPLWSKRDNGRLATNILVSQAEGVLQRALPSEMRGPLHDVAESMIDDARVALANWFRYAADSRDPHRAEWQQLTNREGFMELALALCDTFVVCAVTDPRPGKRQILKIAYEEPGPFAIESRWFLAWRWKVLGFEANQSRLADSYHFELVAPTDMEAGGGRLEFEPHFPQSQDPLPEIDIDVPEGQLVHLYTSNVPDGMDTMAYVFLRPRREGNLRAALLTGVLATVLLWLGYVELDDLTDPGGPDHSQVAAALLLLGPTLLAAALVRPGEHRLVTQAFLGVRLLTVGCILSLLVAVGLLAGAFEGSRDAIWLAAAIVASACAAGLLAAYIFPRSP